MTDEVTERFKLLEEQILCLRALQTRMLFALQSQSYALDAIWRKAGYTATGQNLDKILADKTRELTHEFLRQFADSSMGDASRIAQKIAEFEKGNS